MDDLYRFALAVLLASLPLPVAEVIDRHFKLGKHGARKVSHVLGAIAACLLVFIINMEQIVVLGLIFCLVLYIVRRYRLVKSLYKIDRQSYGELLFPLGVSTAALLSPSDNVYIAVILVMGLADTMAEIVGTRLGWRRFKIMGCTKSLGGNAAFAITAFAIFLSLGFGDSLIALAAIIAMASAEALSGYGTDNFTIPLVGSIIFWLAL